jgi:hypothetical protein
MQNSVFRDQVFALKEKSLIHEPRDDANSCAHLLSCMMNQHHTDRARIVSRRVF